MPARRRLPNTVEIKQDFQRFLSARIADDGLSQREAADHFGMPRSYISRVQNGRTKGVSFESLFRMMTLVGFDISISVSEVNRKGVVAFINS